MNTIWLLIIPLLFILSGILHSHHVVNQKKVNSLSASLYGIELISPFVWIGLFSITGIFPITTVFIFLTLPVAIGCAKTMKNAVDSNTWTVGALHMRTMRFAIMFSVILSVGFVTAKFIG